MLVLCAFKEQLQQHVRVHAVEAVMACRDIEQNLQSLTGTPPSLHKYFGAKLTIMIYLFLLHKNEIKRLWSIPID